MSQANSAIHGPYRRKVTLACDSCRKRRVKCSGSQPCTLCSESGRHCEFDSKSRGRRGPRPRRTVQSQRIIHQLAARIPSSEQVAVSSHPNNAADILWHPQEEMQDVEEAERCVTDDNCDGEEEENEEEDDDDDDHLALDPSVWKPGLEDLIYSNGIISKILPMLNIDLMCHLIHVFCTRANTQLRSLLSPAQLQHHLSQGTMSRALVLAVCASSMRFTVHKAVRGAHAREFAESMEREARNCIQATSAIWQQVNDVKTICVLIDYEASRAHGRQAWIDIAMGRSLVQLARADCRLDTEQSQVLNIAERYLAIAQASHCLGHRHLQPSTSLPVKRPRLECAPCPEDCPHLVELLEVLACIYQLCLTPFMEQDPPPWTLNSGFRALQDDLEEYLLRHPSTFRFGSNSPSSCPSKLEDLDASISSMHALFVGFACMQSALVSINRLHRSPQPYDNRIVENLKLAFIVLGALKTFYAPAKEWMDVLFRAHDANTRLRHASEIIDMSFHSYFSRFLDIEEPPFMPLHPKHSDNTPENMGGNNESESIAKSQNDHPSRSQGQQDLANRAPEWLQAYAGHLSRDIDTDDEQSTDESPRSSTVHIDQPPLQANSTMTQVIPAPAFHEGQGQDCIETGISEVLPVHMAGAILTSMSSGTPSFPLQSQSQQLQLHGQSHPGYDRRSMTEDTHDAFPGLFSQMPTFAELGGLGPEVPVFPELESVVENIARIALAIDYNGNGYRSLLPMAVQEPAVLNAALAVAASHHSRWQRKPDTVSRKYLRAASKALRERFMSPNSIHDPVTLASMLLLVSFEVFSGSSRWKGHYDAIRGWIRSRGDCSDLEPFLKTWVCLIDTQTALNLGQPAMPELESWLDITAEQANQGEFVDALFGCSSRLPKLMWAASRLYAASKDNQTTMTELQSQVDALQAQIRSTAIILESSPLVNISCRSTAQPFATVGMGQEELRRRMVATAEIFRHSSHIYVHRILHGPEEPLTEEMQASLDTAQELLTMVPDALGPGANLGWCLVVIGAEMDGVHQRDYVQSRLDGLHLLGIHNTKNGQKILDEVWTRRDLVTRGQATPERWQDTMQRIGQSQILV
ncbi:hypothetical protein PENCOP_c007G01356 [Penicillium coprophilum]|uniref:Zn(2)-C6 fungal-type domain-containing protein n=1 Tax=Penicillium coprophilum TaxID=36646 RepID=A0A1V6ULF1_9EURO|nr:hypothetical protein PENCOP_c007G01356 [Penicillium coprophilum]